MLLHQILIVILREQPAYAVDVSRAECALIDVSTRLAQHVHVRDILLENMPIAREVGVLTCARRSCGALAA